MIDETREAVERLNAPIDHGALREQRRQTAGRPYRGKGMSDCCGRPVFVAGEGLTHWYACPSCGGPQ
jgi:hypothetical protein